MYGPAGCGCNPCYNGYQKQYSNGWYVNHEVVILAIMDIKNNWKVCILYYVKVVILAIMDIKNNRTNTIYYHSTH